MRRLWIHYKNKTRKKNPETIKKLLDRLLDLLERERERLRDESYLIRSNFIKTTATLSSAFGVQVLHYETEDSQRKENLPTKDLFQCFTG